MKTLRLTHPSAPGRVVETTEPYLGMYLSQGWMPAETTAKTTAKKAAKKAAAPRRRRTKNTGN